MSHQSSTAGDMHDMQVSWRELPKLSKVCPARNIGKWSMGAQSGTVPPLHPIRKPESRDVSVRAGQALTRAVEVKRRDGNQDRSLNAFPINQGAGFSWKRNENGSNKKERQTLTGECITGKQSSENEEHSNTKQLLTDGSSSTEKESVPIVEGWGENVTGTFEPIPNVDKGRW